MTKQQAGRWVVVSRGSGRRRRGRGRGREKGRGRGRPAVWLLAMLIPEAGSRVC